MKQTRSILIVLCLPFLFCTQGYAQHSGPYIGGFIGGNALMNAESSDALGSFELRFKPALQGSAVAGWDVAPGNSLGEGRIELEYTRRSNPLDRVKFVEGSFDGGGDVKADSLLLNFFGVLHGNSRWSPYAGVGIGAARIETSGLTVTGSPLGSGSATVFAYQLGAGIDVALTDYLNLDLGYRFFSSARPKLTEANGQTFAMDYVSHNAVLGLRVGF
ncbi:MAG: outer membrane beta-barrel protein [Desulfuromonadaceae bacterium]|nr:outer membrane beta-barrel protein [Desulfuromonadaceae bacterium]